MNDLSVPSGQRSAEARAVMERVKAILPELAERYPEWDKSFTCPVEDMQKLKKTGVLGASVPLEYGGLGMSNADTVEITRLLATANPSIAQMYLVHATIGAGVVVDFASEALRPRIFREVVAKQAFIANASGEKKSRTVYEFEATVTPVPERGGYVINGTKFFCTGSAASDYLIVFGMLGDKMACGLMPTHAPGIKHHNDWKSMGQRGTSSGSITFENAFFPEDMLMPNITWTNLPPYNIFGPLCQACFSAVYVGAARGAYDAAVRYVQTKTRVLTGSGVNRAVEDPYILRLMGDLAADVAAAEAILARVSRRLDELAGKKDVLGEEALWRLRGEVSNAVSELKVFSTRAALRVGQDILQACGARAGLVEEDMDRYWRDIRMLTLHDPMDYKARAIGEFYLQNKMPPPGFRS